MEKPHNLRWARLEGANLSNAQLEGAYLYGANFKGADLRWAHPEKAYFSGVQLEGANLGGIQLEGVYLSGVQLEGANLSGAQLKRADLSGAQLKRANLTGVQLEEANLSDAQLKGANLSDAQLKGANLRRAQLEGANLRDVQLKGANLRDVQLKGANLTNIKLGNAQLIGPQLADAQMTDTNLNVVDWSQMTKLGDEWEAEKKKIERRQVRLKKYQKAVRANRQLAVVLQAQGLNEQTDHFAYRVQLLQRKVLWHQLNLGRWLFSMLLALLSGYGYRIWRILAVYVGIVSSFAITYFVIGLYYQPSLTLSQAFLVSITSFHGRVFFEQFGLNTPQIWFTAFEAVAGLIVEGVFIAMLIQRFFGK